MTRKEAIDKLEYLINSPVGREEIDETCYEVMKYLLAQEPVVPIIETHWETPSVYDNDVKVTVNKCGACGAEIDKYDKYCRCCGRKVKWE